MADPTNIIVDSPRPRKAMFDDRLLDDKGLRSLSEEEVIAALGFDLTTTSTIQVSKLK